MALEDDLDSLYTCPLGEFIDRRKALAQALRKAGKKDDATRVASATKQVSDLLTAPTEPAISLENLLRLSFTVR